MSSTVSSSSPSSPPSSIPLSSAPPSSSPSSSSPHQWSALDLLQWLISTPLNTVVDHKEQAMKLMIATGHLSNGVITCSIHDRLLSVFNKLLSHQLIACPILDEYGRYLHWISLQELIAYALSSFHFYFKKKFNTEKNDSSEWTKEDQKGDWFIDDIVETEKNALGDADQNPVLWNEFLSTGQLSNATINDIMNNDAIKQSMQSYYPLPSSSSIYTALDLLVKSGAHRLVVLHSHLTGSIENIVSQSDILRLLLLHENQLSHLLSSETVSCLHRLPALQQQSVLGFPSSKRAFAAFRTLQMNRIDGAAIIDSNQQLIGCISIRDLQSIGPTADDFPRLFLSLAEFKALQNNNNNNNPNESIGGAVYVRSTDSLLTLMHRLSSHKIHRVFEILSERDHNYQPIHVITLTDVLQYVMELIQKNPLQ